MVGERYSTTQKVFLAAAWIGAILCVISALTPYWKTAKIDINAVAGAGGFDIDIPFVGDKTLAEYNGGLLFYCIESDLADTDECKGYSFDHGDGADVVGVICALLGGGLAFFCLVISCCKSSCVRDGRTTLLGVMAFVAAAFLLVTWVTFHSNSEQSWGRKLQVVEYAGAFHVFIVGDMVLFVASFALCCAQPSSPLGGLIFSRLSSPSVVVNSVTSNGLSTVSNTTVVAGNSSIPYTSMA